VKRCAGCGEEKALDGFYVCRASKDGRTRMCRPCERARVAAHRAANPDRVKATQRRYLEANRETISRKRAARRKADPAAARARDRARYAADRESIRARDRARYAADPEAARAYERAYRAANPHIAWVARYRQRAKRVGFVPVVEPFTRADLVAAYGDKCWHCGGPFDELDHFPVPVMLGGPHTLKNCRPACRRCNVTGWGRAALRAVTAAAA
jgi:5-methylcytosine-specific restriction endonuclease McrA